MDWEFKAGQDNIIVGFNRQLSYLQMISLTPAELEASPIGCPKKTLFLNLTMALSLNIHMGNTNAIKKKLGILMHFLQSAARFCDFSTRF